MVALRGHYLTTLATNASMLLLGTVSGILAARLLGPVGRGELAVVTLWPMAFATLGALGMNHALTFFTARQPQRRPALLTTGLVLAALQSVLLIAVAYFLLPVLLAEQRPLVMHLARLFLLSIPLMFFSGYLLNLLQGGLHFGAYNLSRLFTSSWYALVLVALFMLGRPSLALIVAGQLAGYAAALLLNAYFVRRHGYARWAWDPALLKPLASYGAKIHLGAVTRYLNLRLDQLVMSVLLAPEALGFYVVAVTLASPLTTLPGAVGIVTLPAAARESPARAHAVIRRSLRLVTLLLVSAAALLYLLVPTLLPLFFGAAFAPAATACRVLVLAMIPLGLGSVLHDSLRGLNHPLAPFYAELPGNGVMVVLLYLWLPRYGYLGAAYASLAAYTVSFLFLLGYIRWRAGFSLSELWGAGPSAAHSPAGTP